MMDVLDITEFPVFECAPRQRRELQGREAAAWGVDMMCWAVLNAQRMTQLEKENCLSQLSLANVANTHHPNGSYFTRTPKVPPMECYEVGMMHWKLNPQGGNTQIAQTHTAGSRWGQEKHPESAYFVHRLLWNLYGHLSWFSLLWWRSLDFGWVEFVHQLHGEGREMRTLRVWKQRGYWLLDGSGKKRWFIDLLWKWAMSPNPSFFLAVESFKGKDVWIHYKTFLLTCFNFCNFHQGTVEIKGSPNKYGKRTCKYSQVSLQSLCDDLTNIQGNWLRRKNTQSNHRCVGCENWKGRPFRINLFIL